MNDEIKEILDILKNCKDYDDEVFLIKQHSAKLLLDYITNLQQDNEMYAQLKNEYEEEIKNLQQENEKIGKLWREEEAHCILLQQENEYLKKTNDEKTKIGVADHKYASQMEDKVIELQQENERLKELCDKYEEEHSNEFKIWKEERHELLDYKSRCEKASDNLKRNYWINEHEHNDDVVNLSINILQNGDSNEVNK